jgi:hypothetical protein
VSANRPAPDDHRMRRRLADSTRPSVLMDQSPLPESPPVRGRLCRTIPIVAAGKATWDSRVRHSKGCIGMTENGPIHWEPAADITDWQLIVESRVRRARRRVGQFHRHVGVQGRPLRAHVRQDRPVRTHVTDVLGVWTTRRTEAAVRPVVDVPVRHCPRPGRQRGQERARPGTLGEPKRPWSAG